MKKYIINRFLGVLCLPFFLLACADEEAPVEFSNDFAGVGTGFQEADGDASIIIPFRNTTKTLSLADLKFSGQATQGEDYEIVGVTKEGISLNLFDDSDAEKVETIKIEILNAPAGNYIHTVTLVSDDPGFLNVKLLWTDAVDLDLYSLYYDEEIEDWEIIDFSDPGNTLDPIDWTDPDGLYGFSYNYYAGTDASVPFSSVFTPTGVKLNGGSAALTFNATYTLNNVDPNSIQVEQTCMKLGTNFNEFTDIDVPAEGSRIRGSDREELVIKMRKAIERYKSEQGK